MGYWPSVRSRWLDIGQVLFLRVYGPRRRSINTQKKEVVSGVISSTESESEESERSHFLVTPLMTPSLVIQWKLDCRSRKQKRKNHPITMLGIEDGDWFARALLLPTLTLDRIALRFCLRLRVQNSTGYVLKVKVTKPGRASQSLEQSCK